MTLALFDLDNTLLNGDSDHAWGEYIVDQGLVDNQQHQLDNDHFYQQYLDGELDIDNFLMFQLNLLHLHPMQKLIQWRDQYMKQKIEPMIDDSALKLVAQHQEKGHRLVVVTSTNSFLTRPIAQRYGIDELIATEPEVVNGQYTGQYTGTACFQQGKVERIQQWLKQHDESLIDSWGYSDSHNDIPFLSACTNPVAVDPDHKLLAHARQHKWTVLKLHTNKNT